jgi:very-short-patch-repair endonuclease
MVKSKLDINKINYISQHPMYNQFIVDFYLPDNNIIIEVQGDYWHGNPNKYGNENGLKPLTQKQIDKIGKDKKRYEFLINHNHIVYMIWESDIYKNTEECLKFLNI